ncbi:MAG: hypothetical protein NTNFB01_19140 [Nitrospira sp.]
MRDDRDRLQDILDAIKNTERYAKRGRRLFEEDELAHTSTFNYRRSCEQAHSCLSQNLLASSMAADHHNATCLSA